MYKLHILLISCCFVSSTLLGQLSDKDDVTIEMAEYELEFYLNDDDVVNAELRVTKNFKYNSFGVFTIGESIFFDNHSEIKRIRKDGSRIKPIISDYQSDGIFHSDLKICYFEAQSESYRTLTISYRKVFNDVMYIDPFYFLDSYDTEDSKITIYKPDWIDLNIVEWNFDNYTIVKDEKKEKDETVYTYEMKQSLVPKYDRGIPSFSQVYPHLIFNVKSATVDNKEQAYLRDVGDLYNWYHSLAMDIGNDNSQLKSKVDELIKGKDNDLDKVKSIFYWVQDNIRYVAFEYGIMGFRPEACQSVMKNKFGDCKGMANLTKEMLSLAGLDARLTWIGTNSLPYDYSIPSLIVDNHMICTVYIDGKPIYLDATEKNADLYHYASRIQGKQVLIEDGDSYIIDNVPEDKKANIESYSINLRLEDNKLIGKGKMELYGGKKVSIFSYLKSLPNNKRQEYLTSYLDNRDKNIELTITKDLNLDLRDQTSTVEYDLEIDNHIIDLGSELYVNTETDYTFKNFEKIKERTIPYDLTRELVISNETKLEVPAGFTIDYLPSNLSVENEYYKFDLGYEKQANDIIYKKQIEIKEKILPTSQFEGWNNVLGRLKEFYSDQIILKKL